MKKNEIIFTVVLLAVLGVAVVLFMNFTARVKGNFDEYSANLTNMAKWRDSKIESLSMQLALEEKENKSLRNTLAETRNALENLSKKLIQPEPVAAAPVSTLPASVTK